jgi:hypothetical protein
MYISSVMVRWNNWFYLKYGLVGGGDTVWSNFLAIYLMIVFVKSSFFLRWKKQEYNKLELQVTSAQFKGSHVVYLK